MPRRAPGSRPVSTYRLQLRGGLGFTAARRLAGYLSDLGVSDLYLSPILAARRDSAHGYDVVDPTRLDPALGTRSSFDRLARDLSRRRMGIVLDIVPNHMAASTENRWWRDVLTRGRRSPWAEWFDIDWTPSRTDLRNKVLLPILGRTLPEVLALGEIRLILSRGRAEVAYFEHRLPIDPRSRHLVPSTRSATPEAIARVLDAQHYRLAWWKRASERINYRRFFNISDLVAVRIEEPAVFAARHGLHLDLVARGLIRGLRVDHVDGLADPGGYLDRLVSSSRGAPWLLVEKILLRDEDLPPSWPVDGTTGYDFLDVVNGLLVDRAGHARLVRIWQRHVGRNESFENLALRCRKEIVERHFSGELKVLARHFRRVAESRPGGRRMTSRDAERALVELTCSMPVYRTYIRGGAAAKKDARRIRAAGRAARKRTEGGAHRAVGLLERVLLSGGGERMEFVTRWQQFSGPVMAKGVEDTAFYRHAALLCRNEVGGDPGLAPSGPARFHARMKARSRRSPRAMNATSTHDTKRGEDVRARLAALSEIPAEWGPALSRWSRWNEPARRRVAGRPVPDRAEEAFIFQTLLGAWPLSAREIPAFRRRMRAYVVKAAREAKRHTSWLNPSSSHEEALSRYVDALIDAPPRGRFRPDFLALQERLALMGAVNGLSQLLIKAAAPGVPDFYQGTDLWDLSLVDPDNRRPVDYALRRRLLARIRRRDAKDCVGQIRELAVAWRDGRIKLYVTWKLLSVRRDQPGLMRDGEYLPLEVRAPRGRPAIAFARRRGRAWAVAAAPLRAARLADGNGPPMGAGAWPGGRLLLPRSAPDRWQDAFSGETIRTVRVAGGQALSLPAVFRHLPVALLLAKS